MTFMIIAVVIEFMGEGSFNLTPLSTVSMDWNQNLIESVYSVNSDQSCTSENDVSIHYPWYGAEVGVEEICTYTYDSSSGIYQESCSYIYHEGFPMVQLNMFFDKKYCLKSYSPPLKLKDLSKPEYSSCENSK